MSFPSEWGPYPFTISTDTLARHITLTQTTEPCTNVPSGTPYRMLVRRDDGSGGPTPTLRGIVMLDDNGVIQGFCNLLGGTIGGHTWKHMTGKFNADGSSTSGGWNADSQPDVIINGSWGAGGGGEPFGHHHDKKHGQHA
jgi:hypothetical protein